MNINYLVMILLSLTILSRGVFAAPKAGKSTVVNLRTDFKCETLLGTTGHVERNLGDMDEWGDFTTLRETTESSLAALGLGSERSRELHKLHITYRYGELKSESVQRLPGLVKILRLFAVSGFDKPLIKTLVRELAMDDASAVEWKSNGGDTEMGFAWPHEKGLRIFLSVKDIPEFEGDPNEYAGDIDDLDWNLDYTLGIDVPCEKASSYSTAASLERIKAQAGEIRCRIPIIRFKGKKFRRRGGIGGGVII